MLIAFFDVVSEMLEESINLFCDSFDIQEKERKFNPFNCIVKISYKDDVRVSIICFDKQALPISFENILYDYLYEKLFISQFRIIHDGILSFQKNEDKDILFLNFILNEKKIGKINIDK
jgi:hypothetical protein